MRRSLTHYWRINLAVLLGAAIATAVLTGALLVGDSVRGSLRALTLDRLGKIDFALVSQKFFGEELAVGLTDGDGFEEAFESIATAIITNGTAVHASSKARASKINILAVDEQFFSFYESGSENQTPLGAHLRRATDQTFPSIIINQSLQNELRAEVGDQILLSFERPSDIARGSLLGNKATEDVVETSRFILTQIIPDRGVGRFGLRPHQTLPLNAYVSLPVLQRTLDQRGRVNAILLSRERSSELTDSGELLESSLRAALSSEDLGLQYADYDSVFSVESKESILSPQLVEVARSAAEELDVPVFPSYTYLANAMESNDRILPYSTVAALNTTVGRLFKGLVLTNGQTAPRLRESEILLNEWAARDLRAAAGDSLEMSYYIVGARDELITEHSHFEVKGVVKMQGLGADADLTPDFPGIADADNMADWDPPFPVDLSLIRPKDEAYWDQYRGAPKAFVSEEAGTRLWRSRFGQVTSLRIGPAPGLDVGETLDRFEAKLLEKVVPQQFGFVFQPIKEQGLASSSGATDFGVLFIAFSQFLIVSAALLVGLLFRLGIEQRANEVGLLLAVGYPAKMVRRQFLKEGGLLALIGALVGLAGAVFYAWVLMVGLRTWWLAAVGSPFLFLHVQPLSLVIGFAASTLVILFAIWLGFRKLSKVPPPLLLAGVATTTDPEKTALKARITGFASAALALLLTASAFIFNATSSAGLFFGVGALLLVSGLAFFSVWLRGKHRSLSQEGIAMILRMAARNSPRNPGRSMLSAALVGCACFVIVAVESFRIDFGAQVLNKESGAGGYSLVAEADVPLQFDLSTENGRFELGFSDAGSERLNQAQIIPFRLRPGDDASCLNLYEVQKPRILGVTAAQIERGGFRFQQVLESGINGQGNPWSLLNQELGPNVIPAFGDFNSVLWILHSGLGKDFVITNEFGQEIKLRFVGLLAKSIFQSELLISEENFVKHFPGQNGYSYFLVQAPTEEVEENAKILESTLSDYGFDSSTTVEKLASFQAVENTYLSTFQSLGGLGLLLGTFGLGIILIRNVIERRGELATLRAFGYQKSTLALLVLGENGFLLILGILIGGLSAVVAVAPHLFAGASQVPWGSLALILLVVFLVGMLASSAAVRAAVRIPLLPALKAE